MRCILSSLFDDSYLAHKYAHGRERIGDVLRAFIRRLWEVLTIPRQSLLLIEYELLPWFPAVFERWLAWRGCRMVVDYDDALFHQYDEHPNPWVRRLLGRKIATVMRLAHTVVAGNSYLVDYARRAGARRVVLLPTVIDLDKYPLRPQPTDQAELIIGWLGSPSTAKYLQAIAPALARICAGGKARVRLVGSGPIDLHGVPTEIVSWSEATETAQLHGFNIGIMPLPDEPWARGKCGFKLIQYMACGLPVVASPVGVNCQIVEDSDNGYLAATETEWISALTKLLDDAALRERMGRAGRQKVEQEYCLQVTGTRLADLLKTTASI